MGTWTMDEIARMQPEAEALWQRLTANGAESPSAREGDGA